MELPTGEQLKTPVQVLGQNYQVRVTETAEPGFYQLRDRGQALHTWAVNFNAAELSTAPVAVSELAAAAGLASLAELSAEGDVRAQVEAARYGSELWQVFLIAAIIAMIVEMLLYRSAPAGVALGKSNPVSLTQENAGVV